MFIAHLPSGYIGACYLADRSPVERRRGIFGAMMLGSIFPDFDMFYFYLIDRGQHLHHGYWTHLPIYWLAALTGALLIASILRSKTFAMISTAFIGGVFLHLLLDTPFGGISWFYPFSEHSFHLVTVPASRSWWVWSFVFHWTFLFEIAICVWAAILYFTRRARILKGNDDKLSRPTSVSG